MSGASGPQEARPAAERPDGGVLGDTQVLMLPLDEIVPAEYNPRHSCGDLTELVRSIHSVGLLQPLVVTARPTGGYQVVCGERRLRAAMHAGLAAVACLVRDFNEPERQEAMLIENLQRRTLRPLEEARAYERLIALGYTQAAIGQRVGRSQGHISRRLSLLGLPEEVQREVDRKQLPVNQALGYEPGAPVDIFEADERLQLAWLALRQEVIELGNGRLIRLMQTFSRAFAERMSYGAGGSAPEAFRRLQRPATAV